MLSCFSADIQFSTDSGNGDCHKRRNFPQGLTGCTSVGTIIMKTENVLGNVTSHVMTGLEGLL